jgi:parvulin-like peptidyl-prolyl isomerase
MEMKTRLLLAPLCLAAVAAFAAGCGGGSGSVSPDAIANVGGTPITKSSFSGLMDVGLANYKAHGQKPPKVGTPLYTQLKDSAVSYLVQQEELTQAGKKLGVTVSQKDIDAKLATVKATQYQGSEKKLEAALKGYGITLAEYEQYVIRYQVLGQKLYDKVTSSVTVSKSAAKKYYDQNKASFTTQAETTRSVRHILVDSKSLAETLETKLKNGANFAALARKYSKDTGSAQLGGKLTAVKGQLVKPFQDVAFSIKTGQISAPVHSQFGWHIIQALGPIKNTPMHVTPFAQAEPQIQQTLLTQQKGQVWSTWLAKLPKEFKVSYQTGYQPPPTTTATNSGTTTAPPTTTG